MNSFKFLVVDDSLTMRRIIITSLRAIGYLQFVEAADGQEAVRAMKEGGIDFIIADWNMPVMTGIELANWVRNDNGFRHVPILMVTTKSNVEDVLEAMRAEIDDYIIKPFEPHGLKEKIDKILQLHGLNATRA